MCCGALRCFKVELLFGQHLVFRIVSWSFLFVLNCTWCWIRNAVPPLCYDACRSSDVWHRLLDTVLVNSSPSNPCSLTGNVCFVWFVCGSKLYRSLVLHTCGSLGHICSGGDTDVVFVLDIQSEFVFGSRRWRRPEPLVSVPGQRSRGWWCSRR